MDKNTHGLHVILTFFSRISKSIVSISSPPKNVTSEPWLFVLYRMSQKKITIGLSASITLKVWNKSKSNFRLWNYNLLPAFCKKIPLDLVKQLRRNMNFYKVCHETNSLQVLTKCRIIMHKNQFMLSLLNDMKRKSLACFYPLYKCCAILFFPSMINWFS